MKLLRPIILIVCTAWMSLVYSQKLEQITFLHGSKTINGIKVSVKGEGQVDSLQYCGEDTWPFYLGYNYKNPECGDGTYTIKFSQPVSEIVVNLSAMSHSDSYDEECIFYINGQKVKVGKLGTNNGCGEGLAILTNEGTILPCRNCCGSGVNGLKFKGPISTFAIECKILLGAPMGFVASVWFNSKPMADENTLVNYSLKYEESTAGDGRLAVIEGDLENAELTIRDKNGSLNPLFYRCIEKNKIVLDLGDLRKGEYLLEIKNGGKVESQKIFIL